MVPLTKPRSQGLPVTYNTVQTMGSWVRAWECTIHQPDSYGFAFSETRGVGIRVVSEPDPRKSKRRVWHIGRGGSVHCGMLGILLIAEPCKVYRVFC